MSVSLRLLLIADLERERAQLDLALAQADLNFRIEVATSANALAAAERGGFDCVLVGAELRDLDPIALVSHLSWANGGLWAVVAVTRSAEAEFGLLRAGAHECLRARKPTGPKLKRAIEFATARAARASGARLALAEAQLRLDEIEEAQRRHAAVLSRVSHDLRNPLQALLGMTEFLAMTANENAATFRRAKVVHEAGQQAFDLVETLFEWAAWKAKPPLASFTAVALDAAMTEAVESFATRARMKGVTISAEAANLPVMAQADALASLIRHLLAHALKHTCEGGGVDVAASLEGDRVALSIVHGGTELSSSEIDAVNAIRPGPHGERALGLQLLLCRELAKSAGGALHVESPSTGGARFTLLLPAAASVRAPREKRRLPA